MKVEMGESLFYSWLRHIRRCQIVQTNWKPSSQWKPKNENTMELLMTRAAKSFYEACGYSVFKKTYSFSQLVRQAEIDALGISLCAEGMHVYAIDVAFHEGGLIYGTRQETAMKVVMKCLRAAMCLQVFFDASEGDIIFASPKINKPLLEDIKSCLVTVDTLIKEFDLNYNVRVLANDDFKSEVIKPVLTLSNAVADTSELFLRSYQLHRMFEKECL